jgi:hypothetical protein
MKGYDFEAIKQQFPLTEVIGKALKIRKTAGWYEALCPFHQENSPSLKFKENDESWHCFGCSAHGDVIDFVAKMENVTTQEAIARLTGGKAIELTAEDREKRRQWLEAEDRKNEAARVAAIAQAQRRWDRATPIDGANGYLDRKQIAPCGARAEGRNLLVPMWDADGELINVQMIPPKEGDDKLFQKDAPTIDGRFYIGLGFGRAIICEGFATAASIFEATADRVVVAFSQGQIPNIAKQMQEAGVSVVIAADRKALDAMQRLGRELDVPVIAPPPLAKGDDFNDQMIEQGVDAVAATFRQGLIDFGNRPEPAPEAPACAISFVDAMDFKEADIPLRPWIVPGAMLAGATHILAAPGGTGKSVFTLQLALMLASGEGWAKWKPKRKCRVLIINAEDDIAEQRRRMVAARTVMGMQAAPGMIMLADAPENILMATADATKKAQVATPLVDELVQVIKHYKIDVVIVDPFAETFDGDENSNGDTKWAMKIWRDKIARPTGAAVYLVHHTTKGSEDKAGSADVIRGGGAIVNSARLAATLFVMSKGECSALGVKEDQRFRYVRYDDAKSNNSLIGGRTWFEKISVTLQNGPVGDSEGGDEVGALAPWVPQGIGAYEPALIIKLLEAMEEGYIDEHGVCTEMPFGKTSQGGSKRWLGYLIAETMGLEDDDIKTFMNLLIRDKLVNEIEFHNGIKNRTEKGLQPDMEAAKLALGLSPKT